MEFESIESFMKKVKEGDVRSDFCFEKIDKNIVVELSVGSFEYGTIFLRVFVQQDEIEVEEDMYYRKLYKVSDFYKKVHEEIRNRIESENETKVSNSHEWTAESHNKVEKHPDFPTELQKEKTDIFSERITLRDDVTIIEALETNRSK